jgi:hypothetical protein
MRMESKKLNVTEEWLQVITQITLSYQRKVTEIVKVEDHTREFGQVDELIFTSSNHWDSKRENQQL